MLLFSSFFSFLHSIRYVSLCCIFAHIRIKGMMFLFHQLFCSSNKIKKKRTHTSIHLYILSSKFCILYTERGYIIYTYTYCAVFCYCCCCCRLKFLLGENYIYINYDMMILYTYILYQRGYIVESEKSMYFYLRTVPYT